MSEHWEIIEEFPDYEVSSLGRVRNRKYKNVIAQARTQTGLLYVGLSKDGVQYKRAVTRLVALAFVPQRSASFDTPIQLDGDRSNNDVDNIQWRPRWFAHRYHHQFKDPVRNRLTSRVIDTKTLEVYESTLDCCMKNGLLERELIVAIMNRTYVWPTYQVFQILEE